MGRRFDRLAIVMATSDRDDFDRAAALALAARRADVEVAVFAMDDAVALLADAPAFADTLTAAGCELTACAHSAHVRGLGAERVPITLGSQDDHAAIVHAADRTVAFT
jgi:predicted peroxiredoxin